MNKAVLLILIGTLALLTESCSFFTKFADSRKELEETAVKPVPVQVNTSPQTNTQETETETEFADLEEEIEPVQEITGLIPATNPDARVRSSVRGRNDPFSLVSLNPRIEIDPEQANTIVSVGKPPVSQPSNQDFDNQSDLDLLEPEVNAEPTLAQEVIISGLYEADGRVKIIVQAPEEDTSRYVEAGQYLSNGQVLVKSIDKDYFPYPLVILEQSGIEVAKTIGSSSDDDEEDVASLPIKTINNDWLSSVPVNSN